MRLENRFALVTGASRGIGRAIARVFAAEGARVALHYSSNRSALEEVLLSLPGSGHIPVRADLGNPDEVRKVVERVGTLFGRLDILVNNAGIYDMHPPLATEPAAWLERWNRTIAVNLTGAAQLTHLAARMMATTGGRIINISSRGAFRGEPDAPAYGASKAGLNALSQSMATALAPNGICVFAVAPGWVDTDMAAPHMASSEAPSIAAQSPLNRIATPDEIASIVLWLAAEAPAFMTGAIIDANGASYLRT